MDLDNPTNDASHPAQAQNQDDGLIETHSVDVKGDESQSTGLQPRTRGSRSLASSEHPPSTQTTAKSKRKSNAAARSKKASPKEVVPVEVGPRDETGYPLTRVQKIVKMDNEQVQISREAAFVLALATEEMTRRLAQAGSTKMTSSERTELQLSDLASIVAEKESWAFLQDIIPLPIPLSVARERRLQREQDTANDNSSPPTQSVPKPKVVKKVVAKTAMPTTNGVGNGFVSNPSGHPTYSLREARAAANSRNHPVSNQGVPSHSLGYPASGFGAFPSNAQSDHIPMQLDGLDPYGTPGSYPYGYPTGADGWYQSQPGSVPPDSSGYPTPLHSQGGPMYAAGSHGGNLSDTVTDPAAEAEAASYVIDPSLMS